MPTGAAADVLPPELARLADAGWPWQDRLDLVDGIWIARATPIEVRYPVTGHADLEDVEGSSFWFGYRNQVVLDLLDAVGRPAALWDVGAGNGFVGAFLQEQGIEVVTVEPGAAGARTAAARGVGASVCGTLEALALPDASLAAVGLFDVLEHVPDPRPLLDELHRVLAPAALLVLSVPALPWLWSQSDEEAGHARRYTRSSLDCELAAVPFRRLRSRYAFAAAVPAVAVARALPWRRGRRLTSEQWAERARSELRGGTDRGNRLSAMVFRAERRWARRLPMPFGTSVFAAYVRVP